MIRKTRSISTKLFVLTTLFLLAFLTLLMVVQSTFFESYYERKKMNELRAALEQFRDAHYRPDENVERLLLPELGTPFSATLGISRVNDGMLVLAPQSKTKFIRTIDKFGNVIESTPLPPIAFPDQDTGLKQLSSALNDWRKDPNLLRRVLDLGHTVSFRGRPGSSAENAIVAVSPLPGSGGTNYVLLAVSSLQPVGEAAAIVRDFYLYFVLLAIGLILLLTYFYSRMIARPLVRMNAAAERMAKLDFTAECETRSGDEIGSLGKTLNFLSRNLNDTLAQLHEANTQLKADIENEKRLERLRREFVASVSHELKTPISLIGGYAEGLRDGIVQGARRDEYLDVIVEETERMANLVRDMLDLSQLEAGQFRLAKGPFRIASLAESLTENMFVELHKKRIVCEVSLEDPNATVIGDEFRIGQVLTNLLSNAIKHTPDGGKIRIGSSEGPGSGTPGAFGTMWIEVFNEGEPIPESELEHIWDTFYTVDKSRNRALGGTGIGLAIVRNILTLHGSSFGVRNVQGGVVFSFSLPMADEPEATG